MKDKKVIVEVRQGDSTRGKLIAHEGTHVVILKDDGSVVSIAKQDATALKSDEVVQPKPPPPPAEATSKPPDDWKWHKFGAFTLHGVGYSRWRTPYYTSGAASYNLDAGVGFNFSARLGVYALVGGAVGARLRDKQVKGNYGHIAVSFLVRRKYVAFMPGIGLSLSRRRGPDDALVRETGVALPFKLMGLVPLPKDLSLTIGVGYDLAILANTRPLNSIALQVGVARF